MAYMLKHAHDLSTKANTTECIVTSNHSSMSSSMSTTIRLQLILSSRSFRLRCSLQLDCDLIGFQHDILDDLLLVWVEDLGQVVV